MTMKTKILFVSCSDSFCLIAPRMFIYSAGICRKRRSQLIALLLLLLPIEYTLNEQCSHIHIHSTYKRPIYSIPNSNQIQLPIYKLPKVASSWEECWLLLQQITPQLATQIDSKYLFLSNSKPHHLCLVNDNTSIILINRMRCLYHRIKV